MFSKNISRPTRAALSARLLPACLLGVSLALSGCLSSPNPAEIPVLAETPAPSPLVLPHGAPPPRACVIIVGTPPPAPQAETPPRSPGHDYVWMSGSWRYYHRHYVWVPGSWALPPRPHATYTPAQWNIVNGNSTFTEGYWQF